MTTACSNHLGSITEITDIYQNAVKTYDYDSFGNVLGEDGSLAHNAFTYTAREYHPRSGLYYYRARWYDPEIGRFITQDPIGSLDGVNLYSYVRGDPVNWIDPLGLAKCYCFIGLHTLVVISEDGKSRAVIGPGGIFSGSDEYVNDPTYSGEGGPITPGIYKMVSSSNFGGSYWLDEGLFRRILYRLGLGRGEFFLHLGTRSLGCITVDRNNPEAVEQFGRVAEILKKDRNNSLEVLPY